MQSNLPSPLSLISLANLCNICLQFAVSVLSASSVHCQPKISSDMEKCLLRRIISYFS